MMESRLAPVELFGRTLRERIGFCRNMAAEANRLAADATGEARTSYLNLVREWAELAKAMEASFTAPRGSRSRR